MPDFGDAASVLRYINEQKKRQEEAEKQKKLASAPVQGPSPKPDWNTTWRMPPAATQTRAPTPVARPADQFITNIRPPTPVQAPYVPPQEEERGGGRPADRFIDRIRPTVGPVTRPADQFIDQIRPQTPQIQPWRAETRPADQFIGNIRPQPAELSRPSALEPVRYQPQMPKIEITVNAPRPQTQAPQIQSSNPYQQTVQGPQAPVVRPMPRPADQFADQIRAPFMQQTQPPVPQVAAWRNPPGAQPNVGAIRPDYEAIGRTAANLPGIAGVALPAASEQLGRWGSQLAATPVGQAIDRGMQQAGAAIGEGARVAGEVGREYGLLPTAEKWQPPTEREQRMEWGTVFDPRNLEEEEARLRRLEANLGPVGVRMGDIARNSEGLGGALGASAEFAFSTLQKLVATASPFTYDWAKAGVNAGLFSPNSPIVKPILEGGPGSNLTVGQEVGEGLRVATNALGMGGAPVDKSYLGAMALSPPIAIAAMAINRMFPAVKAMEENNTRFVASNRKIKELVATGIPEAQLAQYNAFGGPGPQERAVKAIVEKATLHEPGGLYDLAQKAFETGNAEYARQLYNRARELDEKPYYQVSDDYIDWPWELAENLVLDPINWGQGLIDITLAGKGIKAAQSITAPQRILPAQDIRKAMSKGSILSGALEAGEQVQKIAGKAAADLNPQERIVKDAMDWATRPTSAWGKLWARTPDSQALLDTDIATTQVAQLLAGVTDGEDARKIVTQWLTDPTVLATKGVSGLKSPEFKKTGGATRFGYGLIGNETVAKRYALIAAARENILASPSLNMTGPVNPMELIADIEKAIHNTARRIYGLSVIDDLPMHAKDAVVKTLPDGRAVVTFLGDPDKATKAAIKNAKLSPMEAEALYTPSSRGVLGSQKAAQKASQYATEKKLVELGSTMPMSQAEAAKYIKDVANATKTAASSPMVKALTTAASVQRNILSDMWLNLRPTHWIRNAMSAQAALMMDDIYSIDRMDDMVKYLAPKFAGSSANVRIGRAFDPLLREKPRNWTRNIWDSEANLYAKLMEAGSGMWTGYKSLGGRVPFGEEAFYTRGYTQAFKNLFRPLWSDIVDSTMMPTIKELGVDDETARRAREVLINTGLNGSKGDVAETFANFVSDRFVGWNLKDIAPGAEHVLDADVANSMESVINAWLTGNPNYLAKIPTDKLAKYGITPNMVQQPQRYSVELGNAIRAIGDEAKGKYAGMLRSSYPQPGVYEWTKVNQPQETLTILDDLTLAAQQAGIPPQQATDQGLQLAQAYKTTEDAGLEAMRQGMQTSNTPSTMNIVFDTLAAVQSAKNEARRQVDDLMVAVRAATKEKRPAAWMRKFQESSRIYAELTQTFDNLFGQAAKDMQAVAAGQEVPRRYSWWDSINRWVSPDDPELTAWRNTEAGSTVDTTPEMFQKIIGANRQYLDSSYIGLYEAARRYPSVEALDILRAAQKNIDVAGAQATAYLVPLREKAKAERISWEDFFKIRNATWRGAFDQMVTFNRAAMYDVIDHGMNAESGGALRWTDDFAGADFMLLGPNENGLWNARNLTTGKIETVSPPGAKLKLPIIPADVANKASIAASVQKGVPPATIQWKQGGKTWQLIQDGTASPGLYKAANMADGKIQFFQGKTYTSTKIEVPQEVLENFDRLTGGGLLKEIDDAVAAIDEVAPLAEKEVAPDLDDGLYKAWAAPVDRPPYMPGTGKPTYMPTAQPGTMPMGTLTRSPEIKAGVADFKARFSAAAAARKAAQAAPTAPVSGVTQAAPEVLGKAIWRAGDTDTPVEITGLLGEQNGIKYYSIKGSSTGVPENQLIFETPLQVAKTVTQAAPEAQAVTANMLAAAAKQANIPTSTEKGIPLYIRLIQSVNKDARAANAGWSIPETNNAATLNAWLSANPEQAKQAVEFLAARAKNIPTPTPTVAEELSPEALQHAELLNRFNVEDVAAYRAQAQSDLDAVNDVIAQVEALPEDELADTNLPPVEALVEKQKELTEELGIIDDVLTVKAEEELAFNPKTGQTSMYGAGEGLPMFTETAKGEPGIPIGAPEVKPFVPEEVQRQESFLNLRQGMGQAEPSYKPQVAPEVPVSAVTTQPPATITARQQEEVNRLVALGKKPLLEKHQDDLLAKGYSKTQLGKMSPEELAHATVGTSAAPIPTQEKKGWLRWKAEDLTKGAKGTQKYLSDEWDRKIMAEVDGVPSLELMARTYSRDGLVNLPESLEKKMQDVYNREVGGETLSSLDDVRAYVQSYVTAGRPRREAESLLSEAREFEGLNTGDIIAKTYDELKTKHGLTDAEIASLATQDRRYVLDQIAGFRGRLPETGTDYQDLTTYDFTVPMPDYATLRDIDPRLLFGAKSIDEVKARARQLYKTLQASHGKTKQPEMADVAVHAVTSIDDAVERIISSLPNLTTPKPNVLNDGQKAGLMQALNTLVPRFDDAVFGANWGAEKATNAAMLNFKDRRGIDQILSVVLPFHYYWTRGGAEWAKRMVRKPAWANAYYEMERAIDGEQAQNGVPERLKGTILAYQDENGQWRMRNPFSYINPLLQYMPNYTYGTEGDPISYLFPQTMPAFEIAKAGLQDMLDPLPNGEKRTAEFMKTRNYAPILGVAADAYKAFTGNNAPDILGGDAQWDYYRTRRTIAVMTQEGKFGDPNKEETQAKALYAVQIANNLEQGKDRYDQIPEKWQKAAEETYMEGSKQAGMERFFTSGTGYSMGAPGYFYPTGEAELRAATADVRGAAYNREEAPYGSAEAVQATRQEYPALGVYSARYPGALSPAQTVMRNEYYSRMDKEVWEPMAAAVEKAITQNGNISREDIQSIKEPFYQKRDAIIAEYPDLPTVERTNRYPYGSNPTEQAIVDLEAMLLVPGAPAWPGDDATPEQLQQYYRDKAAYNTTRLNTIDRRANAFVSLAESPGTSTILSDKDRVLYELIKNRYSADLVRKYDDAKYAGGVERAWMERKALEAEQSSADWESKTRNVLDRMGTQGVQLWDTYMGFGDNQPARERMKEIQPQVRAAIMAGFSPEIYDQAIELFGKDAWKNYYSPDKPKWPGNDATKEQLDAYYEADAKWSATRPKDNEMALWLNGRQEPEGTDIVFTYSPGWDWQEAKRIFGDNIFAIEHAANQAPDYKTWARANQEEADLLTGYREWKKGKLTFAPSTPALNIPSGLGMKPVVTDKDVAEAEAAGLPRPLGSERRPIGAEDWTAGLETPPPTTAPVLPPALAALAAAPAGTAAPLPVTTTAAPENIVPATTAAPGTAATTKVLPGAPPTTPEGWAMLNPKYAKYKASEQLWAQRKAGVVSTFGTQVGDLYEQYLDTPEGAARKQFKADHPELRAVSLYTWNPKEYAQAEELFGKDAILEWAMTPPYAEDEATKKARAAWYDANPGAYLVNAWLNGRPSPRSEEEVTNDAEWEYNFGKDFAEAQTLFGENIWSVVTGYKRGWDKATKGAYYDQYPQLSKFFDWWNGLLPDTGKVYAAGAGTGSGYRSYGGGGGGGGGGKPYVRYPYFNPPKIYPSQLDNSMRLYAPEVRPWRAEYPNRDIDRATEQLRPSKLTAWKAPRRG